MSSRPLDRRTRRLLQATRSEVCRHLGARSLDPSLVGELYLKVREILAQIPSDGEPVSEETVDDIAVTIYLVAVSEVQASPALLDDLKPTIARCLGCAEGGDIPS